MRPLGNPQHKRIRRRRNAVSWTLGELRLLGRKPDSVLARRFGRTIKEVVAERERRRIRLATRPRRWTASEIKLLGIMPDREVSRRLRRSNTAVTNQRQALKIPIFKPRSKFKNWTFAEI